jgi:hypothetical protein
MDTVLVKDNGNPPLFEYGHGSPSKESVESTMITVLAW